MKQEQQKTDSELLSLFYNLSDEKQAAICSELPPSNSQQEATKVLLDYLRENNY